MRMYWVAVAGLGAALITSCDQAATSPDAEVTPLTRDSAALFQTDSLAYTLLRRGGGFSMALNATLTNRTGGSVYISNCAGSTGIHLQKRDSAGWQRVWSPILPACISPPIVIRPEATYRFRVDIVGGEPGSNLFPQFATGDLAGEYRLIWDGVLGTYDDKRETGEPLRESWRISNRFLVRVESR